MTNAPPEEKAPQDTKAANEAKETKAILIAAVTPQFLERGVLWFQENEEKIKSAARNQPFWKQNILILEKDQIVKPSELLRVISDFGYERVRVIFGRGEYSHQGNIISIWPINAEYPSTIEFFGNNIERIIATRKKEPQAPQEKKSYAHLGKTLQRLKPGDYVVHLDHGIGVFKEIKNNFFVIEYAPPRAGAEPDVLRVPVAQEKRLSLYVGFETPTVHRLGGSLWFRTKKKAQESAEKLARELVALYARREEAKRAPYEEDALEKEFADLFAYEETSDQTRALKEIFRDLADERPMDRIVCGDVGFGKTEVAMRAAFRAVLNNKQVAVIAPTAILAAEHTRTFQARFANFPVRIASLSRLTPRREAKSIIEKLKNGELDIVIGTHRLLSKDIVFKRIGLVVIDEEQKFGVKQKEKFKAMRNGIDILSLSATPIPRTLHLALAHLRDISVIETPPAGRIAIKNFVLPYSGAVVRRAIENELSRGGQIYVLHNRVQTIGTAREKLARLLAGVPKARIEIIHGRMREQEMMRSLEKFRRGECAILLATTVIENGLDFSNANTLIVEDASRLGLSQAYQIRGRIGRGNAQAYGYFFYRPQRLTDAALERLAALQEFEELGSGYRVALRDLEIRGAGNMLGREQSGAINKVGLNLYSQILADAVEQLRHR